MKTVQLRETLPLQFQISNYDAEKFVRCFLRDADDLPLVDFPYVDLVARGTKGMYSSDEVTMPNTEYVTAQYVVYDDDTYETPSINQGGGSETFILGVLYPDSQIPLYLQLFDYDPDQYPQAVIRDDAGTIIATVSLEPIGSLGLYGASYTLEDEYESVVAQYLVYSDSGHTTISESQGGDSETFFFDGLDCCGNFGNLPNMSDTLLDYFVQMTFYILIKEVRGYQDKETAIRKSCMGVWQPSGPQQLELTPQGQQSWPQFTLHSDISLELQPDDVVRYCKKNYRILAKYDYRLYGYYEYRLILDYTGAGP